MLLKSAEGLVFGKKSLYFKNFFSKSAPPIFGTRGTCPSLAPPRYASCLFLPSFSALFLCFRFSLSNLPKNGLTDVSWKLRGLNWDWRSSEEEEEEKKKLF